MEDAFFYIGRGHGAAGLGIVDASEIPPTYGLASGESSWLDGGW